jgi:hypothetical protein
MSYSCDLTPADYAAISGNNNNGLLNGDLGALLVLFLFGGAFGGGFGGLGGFGGGNILPWLMFANGGFGGFGGNCGCGSPCATQADVRAAVDQQTLISKLDNAVYGLADSTYAINNSITNGFHGVDNAICNLGYNVQSGFNSLAHQISDCCCTTQRAIDGVRYDMASQACDTRSAIYNSTRDIIDNANANSRAILDFLTQDKIATLTAENQNLKLSASQANQNAVLMAAMDANKAEILRRTGAECPTPAYVVQPPTPVNFPLNCCGQVQFGGNCGGCGSF